MKTKIKKDASRVLASLKYYDFILAAGNGGSAAIANHMACDWMKGTDGQWTVLSLASNTSLLTALANDLSYADVFSKQIEWLNLNSHRVPLVVLISASGNSPNIIKAAEMAETLGYPVIGFTGFDGGKLKWLADLNVHISCNDYGTVEDYHSQVMHEVLRQYKAGL